MPVPSDKLTWLISQFIKIMKEGTATEQSGNYTLAANKPLRSQLLLFPVKRFPGKDDSGKDDSGKDDSGKDNSGKDDSVAE